MRNANYLTLWDKKIRLPQGQPDEQTGDSGAESRTRTGDLRITNALLYQLSYFGD